jgi:hypothetical protein
MVILSTRLGSASDVSVFIDSGSMILIVVIRWLSDRFGTCVTNYYIFLTGLLSYENYTGCHSDRPNLAQSYFGMWHNRSGGNLQVSWI